jgi:hypothetical protein
MGKNKMWRFILWLLCNFTAFYFLIKNEATAFKMIFAIVFVNFVFLVNWLIRSEKKDAEKK